MKATYSLRVRIGRGGLVHAAERKAYFYKDGAALTACRTLAIPTDTYLPDETPVDCTRCQQRTRNITT